MFTRFCKSVKVAIEFEVRRELRYLINSPAAGGRGAVGESGIGDG